MKQIVCEMCGSTDLVKQDGVFVCQSCGTKYSVEEAKKMMVEVEGSVDVSGSTVKVDNSSFVEKYLLNARRALEKTDWEEVEKYYNLVEQNEPENIEAIFYSSYGKAMLSLVDGDRFKRQQKFDVFMKSISVIDDYYDVSKSEELEPLILKMYESYKLMISSSYVFNKTTNGKGETVDDDKLYTMAMFIKVCHQFIESIENIVEKDEKIAYLDLLYKLYNEDLGRLHSDDYLYFMCGALRKIEPSLGYYFDCKIKNEKIKELPYYKKLQEVTDRLNELNTGTEYKMPSFEKPQGGCYVATCVYGSYDCPEVWTLRRFRDYDLAETWYGRAFIHTYYAISPTLVKWFGHTDWFKNMWRGTLNKMVHDLQEKGYENTPYQDRDWK